MTFFIPFFYLFTIFFAIWAVPHICKNKIVKAIWKNKKEAFFFFSDFERLVLMFAIFFNIVVASVLSIAPILTIILIICILSCYTGYLSIHKKDFLKIIQKDIEDNNKD